MSSLRLVLILNGVFFISVLLIKNIIIALVITTLAFFTLLFVLRQTNIVAPHFNMRKKYIIENKHYNVTVVCLVIFVLLERHIGINASLFTSFFIFSYLNKLRHHISFFLSLILLIITALLTVAKNIAAAELSAKLTYYFLIVGVVWYLIEFGLQKLEEFNKYTLSND